MASEDYHSETIEKVKEIRSLDSRLRDYNARHEVKATIERTELEVMQDDERRTAQRLGLEPLELSGSDCVIAVRRLLRGVKLTPVQADEIIKELNQCLGGHHAGSAGAERE